MVVQNVQELFILIASFQLYEILWALICQTGLLAIPAIVILWDNWIEEYRKHGSQAVISSMRKMPVDVLIFVGVVLFFYVPFIKMGVNQIEIAPLQKVMQEPEKNKEEGSNSQKKPSVDIKQMISANHIKVPILFSLFYNWTNGIMYAGVSQVAKLERNSQNLREFESLIYSASISDETLYSEVRRFTSECYIPSKNKYMRLYADNPPGFIEEILSKRTDDLNWIGSTVLLSTQGLYARCENAKSCGDGSAGFQAVHPVKGFVHDKARDAIYRDNQAHPYCDEWWLGESTKEDSGTRLTDASLRARMIKYIRSERKCHGTKQMEANFDTGTCTVDDWFAAMKDHIGSALSKLNFWGVDEIGREAEDAALRHFLRNTSDSLFTPSPYASDKGFITSVQNLTGLFGVGKQLLDAKTTMHVVKLVLPIIQTLLLMLIIIVLPLYGLLSNFDIGSAFKPIIMMGFVKVLAVWWAFISYIDNEVLDLMGVDSVWSAAFESSSVGSQNSITIMMWNLMVTTLYIVMPLLGGMMLQKAGAASDTLGDLGGSIFTKGGGASAENTGQQASNVQNKAASGITGKGSVKI